ncbi:MAG: hypothetical protein AB7F96_19860 [Beijerinckiaceae bacterium]
MIKFFLIFGGPAYLVLQLVALTTFDGRWRNAAWGPLAAMLITGGVVLIGMARHAAVTLLPFAIMTGLCLLWMVLIFWRRRRELAGAARTAA